MATASSLLYTTRDTRRTVVEEKACRYSEPMTPYQMEVWGWSGASFWPAF